MMVDVIKQSLPFAFGSGNEHTCAATMKGSFC